jgi:hypothetical protein
MLLGELFFRRKWRLQAMHHDAVSVSAWCGARVLQVITTARMQHLCAWESERLFVSSLHHSLRAALFQNAETMEAKQKPERRVIHH